MATPDCGRVGALKFTRSQRYLDRLAPTGVGLTGAVNINAREDATGYSGSWKVDVYAICAV